MLYSNAAQGNSSMVRVVRGLDQRGPAERAESLQQIWKKLAASKGDRFHAAEESALRWLLKSMHGNSSDHETLRRNPLTWTILEAVFRRIPLFSLAKSLADRKFISVLQQTASDISAPSLKQGPTQQQKRKKVATQSSGLEDLGGLAGCLRTGEALFMALRCLMARIDNAANISSHEEIGAQHIKSLFCLPAAEATSLVSPLLSVCDLLLLSDVSEELHGLEFWIETISSIWDLHLHKTGDSIDVATHLFNPAASTVSKLESFPFARHIYLDDNLRKRWTSDLQRFMQRNLIIPAKAKFLGRQDFEPLIRALDVSTGNLGVAAPAMYLFASASSAHAPGSDSNKGEAEWIRRIFQSIEEAIRKRKDRASILRSVIQQASSREFPVGPDTLRSVCRAYGLQDDNSTNWDLVAKLSACEPGIFQGSEDGKNLLQDICDRSIRLFDERQSISEIIKSIVRSFRLARNLTGFLQLWFQQLCKIEEQGVLTESPWLDIGLHHHEENNLSDILETDLSPAQIIDIIQWARMQNQYPQSLGIFSSCIARGLQSDAYVNIVGRKLYDLVWSVQDNPPNTMALKWEVVSKSFSWLHRDERTEIWNSVKRSLSQTLEQKALESSETFGAFVCACQAWVAMTPDDENIEEPAKFIGQFMSRLANKLDKLSLDSAKLMTCSESPSQLELRDAVPLEYFLAYILQGCSRLCRLQFQRHKQLPQILQDILSCESMSVDILRVLWTELLQNSNNLDECNLLKDLLDRLIDNFDQSSQEAPWPGDRGGLYAQLLNSLAVDAFSRQQRERIMVLLNRHRARGFPSKQNSLESVNLVLSLATKMTTRPTFYDEMSFEDLAGWASQLSRVFVCHHVDDSDLLEIIGRFDTFAGHSIRQMTDHIDDRSSRYLAQSVDYIGLYEMSGHGDDDTTEIPPLMMTLLKTLVTEMGRSNCHKQEELAIVMERAKAVVISHVTGVLSDGMQNLQAFTSRNVLDNFRIFAAVDATSSLGVSHVKSKVKSMWTGKVELLSRQAMWMGDIRAWKLQHVSRKFLSGLTIPIRFGSLEKIPLRLRLTLMQEHISGLTEKSTLSEKCHYLRQLLDAFRDGQDTDGQLIAIQLVVDQLIGTYCMGNNKS